jgi:Domain of Unknown Function (DUF1206)
MVDLVAAVRGGRRREGAVKRSGRRLKHSRWVEWAGRVGHVAKGVSYCLVAVLALQVAFGDRRQPRDREGVLREVAAGSFGTAVLVLLALGFFAYAFWQFVRTLLDRSEEGSDAKGLAERAHYGVVGVVYAASGIAAVTLALGSHSGAGNEKAETAKVLDWPFGRWLVAVAGLGLVGYGIYNLYQATTKKFREDLRESEMGRAMRSGAVRLGVFGHAARGVVFAMVGFFFTKAAVEYDPDEAVGIDGALAKLAAESYGTWLLSAVALGLLAYGLFCLLQARYGEV